MIPIAYYGSLPRASNPASSCLDGGSRIARSELRLLLTVRPDISSDLSPVISRITAGTVPDHGSAAFPNRAEMT